MVAYSIIKTSNALINDATAPAVSVFVGGTSGIGQHTIRALVSSGASLRLYIIGRPSSFTRTSSFIQELRAINPKAEVLWLSAEISLLADVQRACSELRQKESTIDLLFLSAGYAPLGARHETAEGVEITQSLEHYSRVLFILHLLPLLQNAAAPRVVAVLAGGLERKSMNLDDIDLKKPGSYGMMTARLQNVNLHSIALDKLAAQHPQVTFVHSWPGWVNTGNVWRGIDSRQSWLAWFVWLVLEPLIALFSFSDEESGQRHLFECTSAAYGGQGTPWTGTVGTNVLGKQENGLFSANYKCDCTPNAKIMASLRENAQEKVWEHTMGVLEPFL